jgi:hypothetical protein
VKRTITTSREQTDPGELGKSTKSQAPNYKQAPNPKFKCSKQSHGGTPEFRSFGILCFEFVCDLMLGAWNFSRTQLWSAPIALSRVVLP